MNGKTFRHKRHQNHVKRKLTDERPEEPVKMLYGIFYVPVPKQIVEATRTISRSKKTFRRTGSGSVTQTLQITLVNFPESIGGGEKLIRNKNKAEISQ